MDDEKKNLHNGHRSRLYERYLKSGLDGFSDVEVLELLLAYAIVRRDTNELAHRLLDYCGSLTAVFDAPVQTLLQVQGMTRRAAILLHLQPQVWTYYDINRQAVPAVLKTTDECGDYLLPYFRGAREEQIWMLSLDAKAKLLDCRCVSKGSVNSACSPLRKIAEVALTVNATSVVLAHNHLSGIALPSAEDINTTQRIKMLLKSVDVILADHIVVADNDYVSMLASALL